MGCKCSHYGILRAPGPLRLPRCLQFSFLSGRWWCCLHLGRCFCAWWRGPWASVVFSWSWLQWLVWMHRHHPLIVLIIAIILIIQHRDNPSFWKLKRMKIPRWHSFDEQRFFFFKAIPETGGTTALFTADFFFDLESDGTNRRLGPPNTFQNWDGLVWEWNPYNGFMTIPTIPFYGEGKNVSAQSTYRSWSNFRQAGRYFLSEVPIYFGLFQILSSSFSCFFPTSKCEKKIHNFERTYSLWPDFELQQKWCMEPNEVLKSSSHFPRPKTKKMSGKLQQIIPPGLETFFVPAVICTCPGHQPAAFMASKHKNGKKKNIVPPKLKPKTTVSAFSGSPYIVIYI